jgi:hypothetical protein
VPPVVHQSVIEDVRMELHLAALVLPSRGSHRLSSTDSVPAQRMPSVVLDAESPKACFWGLTFPAGRRRGKARPPWVCSRSSVAESLSRAAEVPKTKPVPFFATRKRPPGLGLLDEGGAERWFFGVHKKYLKWGVVGGAPRLARTSTRRRQAARAQRAKTRRRGGRRAGRGTSDEIGEAGPCLGGAGPRTVPSGWVGLPRGWGRPGRSFAPG